MSQTDPDKSHEIVIVRRRGDGDHDDHHGGVWKVAFADFMTAMMAFFLVLWIVNSTTKQTRSSLARYFNPIRLSDTTPARKGLNDPREVDFDASADGQGRAERSSEATKAAQSQHEDKAGTAAPAQGKSREIDASRKSGEFQSAGLPRSPDEFADPFGPPAASRASSRGADAPRKAAEQRGEESAVARALKSAIEARLGVDQAAKLKDSFSVGETPEGVLISLTDRADLGSFAIGSSEPEERLTRALAAIADVLKGRQGTIVVRGHTDSRPFRGGGSDNWRLSFARAQSAFFGLVQAGFDERRVERVEGYADRKPRNTSSPQAPENRRIEILLRQRNE